ncbi:MAG TPA: class I SAM-dependent methyltransferase [Anaerolineae bacterium]|nr:class I SAM-dependent methyltransferase [Anaerolineae bacterium]
MRLFFSCILAMMKNDPWLEKWLALIQKKSAGGHVLELGCGGGGDTVDLLAAGCNVVATDVSAENLAECAQVAPEAKRVQMDNGKPLPFADHTMPVILTSLSLHYFSRDVTLQIAAELRRCIKDGGILLARFNSTNDYNFGASSDIEIEPDFYQVGTRTKRFFDETSVRLFLQGWDIQFLEENVIGRYQKPKYVWEAMAINLPLDTSPPPS